MTRDDEFVRETRASLRRLTNGLLELERGEAGREGVNESFRTAHTLKGNCDMEGLDGASRVAHAIEDVLSDLRDGTVTPSSDLVDAALDAVDDVDTMLTEWDERGVVSTDASAAVASLRAARDRNRDGEETPSPGGESMAAEEPTALPPADGDEFDPTVMEALDSASDFDDLDRLVAEMDDPAEDQSAESARWGTFDDAGRSAAEAAGDGDTDPDAAAADDRSASAEDARSVPDDGMPSDADSADSDADSADPDASPWAMDAFESIKDGVETNDISSLDRELDDVEFGEFDDDDELSIQDLVSGEFDDEDALGEDVTSPAEPSAAAAAASGSDAADDAARPGGGDGDSSAHDPSGTDSSGIDAPPSAPDTTAGLTSSEATANGGADGAAVGSDENDSFAGFDFAAAVADADEDEDDEPAADADAADEVLTDPGIRPSDLFDLSDDGSADADAAETDAADGSGVEFADAESFDDSAGDAFDFSDVPDVPRPDEGAPDTADAVDASADSVDSSADAVDASDPRPGTADEAVGDTGGRPGDATAKRAGVSRADEGVPDADAADSEVAGTDGSGTEPTAIGETTTADIDIESPDFDVPDIDVSDIEVPEFDGRTDAGSGADDGAMADLSFARDEHTVEFESRFAERFGDDADDDVVPLVDAASSTIEESSLDASRYRSSEATPPPPTFETATTGAADEIQSITVDVQNADTLLNIVDELSLAQLRLERADEDERDEQLSAIASATSELRRTVMKLRLMPLSTVVEGLPRVVRDIARRQDKRVSFEVTDDGVDLDRSIVEKLGDPLVHLARNAVDHGIESPAERRRADKPPEGTVELRAWVDREHVVIEVADDGRGLSADRIRQHAIDRDVRSKARVEKLALDEVYDLVFEPGFSTAEEVTGVSGRGVGMDAVRRTVSSLDGTVAIESEPGEGTTVRIRLPVSVAVSKVLFVGVGSEQYAIPTNAVDDVERFDADAATDDGRVAVEWPDEETDRPEHLPLVRLREAFDEADAATDAAVEERGPGDAERVLVRLDPETRELALVCDDVGDAREVVVRPYEKLLGTVRGISGATMRADGSLVNIIDVNTL